MEFDDATVENKWRSQSEKCAICAICAKTLQWTNRGARKENSWEADHIQPSSEGGNDSLENCQILCWPCHKSKTSTEATNRSSPKRLLRNLRMPTK